LTRPRISYVPTERLDARRQQEMLRCGREGTPRLASSDLYDERQKAALAYAEAIAWRIAVDDALWGRLPAHSLDYWASAARRGA